MVPLQEQDGEGTATSFRDALHYMGPSVSCISVSEKSMVKVVVEGIFLRLK